MECDLMIRRIKESIVSFITGAGIIERALLGLGVFDYAFGHMNSKSDKNRALYACCLDLKTIFDLYDTEHKDRYVESESPSIKDRIIDTEIETKQVASDLLKLTGEKLNNREYEKFVKCIEELRKAELKKLSLINYHNSDAEFSETSEDALKELSALWSALVPDTETPVISNTAAPSGSNYTEDPTKWPYLGFQSSNPFRDFRDTGRLGLRMLKLWGESNPRLAREMLNKSHTGAYYPLCCVGLNVTSWMVEHLTNGDLDAVFIMNDNDEFDILRSIWCYTILEFHRAWICSRPDSILQFSVVRDQFREHLLELLNNISQTGLNNGCGTKISLLPQGVLLGSDVQREFELWTNGQYETRSDSPKIHSSQLRLGSNVKPLSAAL